MSKEYFKKNLDPYKPKAWENKNYIIPNEENFDKINNFTMKRKNNEKILR